MKLFYTEEEIIEGMNESIEALDSEREKIDELLSSIDQLRLPLIGISFQEDYTLLKNDFDVSDFINKITQKYNEIKKKNDFLLSRLDSIISGNASEKTKENISEKISSIKDHQSNIDSIFKKMISYLGQDSVSVDKKREKAEEVASSFGVDVSSLSNSNEGLEVFIEYIKLIINDLQDYVDKSYISIPRESLNSSYGYRSMFFRDKLGFQIYGIAALYSLSKDNFLYLNRIQKGLEECQYFINKIALKLKKRKLDAVKEEGNRSIKDRIWSARWNPSDSMVPYDEKGMSPDSIARQINEEIGKEQNAAFFEMKNNVGKYINDIFKKLETSISKLSLEKIDTDGIIFQIPSKEYFDLFDEELENYCGYGNKFFSENFLKDLAEYCEQTAQTLKSYDDKKNTPSYALTEIPKFSFYVSDLPSSFYTKFCFDSSKILKHLNITHSDVSEPRENRIKNKAIKFFKEDRKLGEIESLVYYKNKDGDGIREFSNKIPEQINDLRRKISTHMLEENISIDQVNLDDIGFGLKIKDSLSDVKKEIQLLNLIINRLARVRGSLFKTNGTTSNFNILKEIKNPNFPIRRIEDIVQKIESYDADFATIRVFSGGSFASHNRVSAYSDEKIQEYFEKSKCFFKISKGGEQELVGLESLIRETVDLFIEMIREDINKIDRNKEILEKIISNTKNPESHWDEIRAISDHYISFKNLGYEKNEVTKYILDEISDRFDQKKENGYKLTESLFMLGLKSNTDISEKMIEEISKSKVHGLNPVEEYKINNLPFSKYRQDFGSYDIMSKGVEKTVSPKLESIILSDILANLSFGYSPKIEIFKNGEQNAVHSFVARGGLYFGREEVSVDFVKNSYSIFYDIFEQYQSSYSFSNELKEFLKTGKKKQNSPRYERLFLMIHSSKNPFSLICFIEIIKTISKANVENSIIFSERILKSSNFVEAILFESLNILSLNNDATNLIDLKDCLDKVDISLGEFEKAFVISNVLKNVHNNGGGSNLCDILYNIFSLDFLDNAHKSEAKSGMLDFASELVCISYGTKDPFSRESFNENLQKLNKIGFEFKENLEDDLSLVSEAIFLSQNVFGDSESGSVSEKENFYKIKAAMNNIKFLKSISNLDNVYLNIFSENKDVEKKEELFDLDFDVIPERLRFRVLRKYDSYAMKVGADTNCCQVLGGAGEPCVIDSIINPTASVLILEAKFEDEESLRSLSGQPLPEPTIDGYRIISQSYFHFVEADTDISIQNKDFVYNKYFVLDNIETSFFSMENFYRIFNINFDEIYKKLSSHIIKKGYNPILVGKSFSPNIITKNTSGRSSSDNRYFHHNKKYTDFNQTDFVVLNKDLDDKTSRYLGINRIYKTI